jgi:hypothetical protein
MDWKNNDTIFNVEKRVHARQSNRAKEYKLEQDKSQVRNVMSMDILLYLFSRFVLFFDDWPAMNSLTHDLLLVVSNGPTHV